MKRIFTFNLVLALFTLINNINGQVNNKNQIKPQAKKTDLNYEYALNDPLNARIYTLKNGMKVYLSVHKNEPRIQTYIAVRAGSKNDPSTATGLAHYLEHMVFKGTDKFGTKNWPKESAEIKKIENLYELYGKTTDESARNKIYHQIDSISGEAAKYAIANEYDKMLAAIGADGTNAYTSFDETVYVNDIPNNQIENWLKIESERFRKLVLRLFHTELEAVYEEKNRGLDNDEDKVYETIMSELFKNHTYGTQTTIGTIPHLKNPSMVKINEYFNKYYVPNNMAIIMSGDFDPDKMIRDIEKNFGAYQPKPVDTYTFQPETPITSKISKEVLGPDFANVNLSWRFKGKGTADDDMLTIISAMLNNGTAGLLDLNINQAQKALNSSNTFWPMNDYSLFGISAQPKEGQSLEEVEKLLMEQINKLRTGDFPEWLLPAVITHLKLEQTKNLEHNHTRANEMLDAFISNKKWQTQVDKLERLSKVTKKDLIDFANKNFNENNYVVVYKRTGNDLSVPKVTKPEITPVSVDRDNASDFVKKVMSYQPSEIKPKFIDYNNDIIKTKLESGIELLYTKNNDNKLFELTYLYRMGKNNDKLLPIAINCLSFAGTKEMNAAKIKEEFFKLGCSFNFNIVDENTIINLSGLSDNFQPAIQLLNKLITSPEIDETVFKNYIADFIKLREDSKLRKDEILNAGMMMYAMYGSKNPYNNVLNNDELLKLTLSEVKSKISDLSSYQHQILYYGPLDNKNASEILNTEHKVAKTLLPVPQPLKFEMQNFDNKVFVFDYDMKQVEIIFMSNGVQYDKNLVPIVSLYNNYFGFGMGSVVFQDLRESKALAYSTYAVYTLPNKYYKKSFNQAYIGSQSDKLSEAIKGMKDLLENMPKSLNSFSASKELLLQDLRTQRIQKSEIMLNYLASVELKHEGDIRKDIFEKVKTYTFEDVKKFQEQYIKGKPTTMLILGKKSALDMNIIEKYGPVKFLNTNDIFGY